jgi:hypothetical protein
MIYCIVRQTQSASVRHERSVQFCVRHPSKVARCSNLTTLNPHPLEVSAKPESIDRSFQVAFAVELTSHLAVRTQYEAVQRARIDRRQKKSHRFPAISRNRSTVIRPTTQNVSERCMPTPRGARR